MRATRGASPRCSSCLLLIRSHTRRHSRLQAAAASSLGVRRSTLALVACACEAAKVYNALVTFELHLSEACDRAHPVAIQRYMFSVAGKLCWHRT